MYGGTFLIEYGKTHENKQIANLVQYTSVIDRIRMTNVIGIFPNSRGNAYDSFPFFVKPCFVVIRERVETKAN